MAVPASIPAPSCRGGVRSAGSVVFPPGPARRRVGFCVPSCAGRGGWRGGGSDQATSMRPSADHGKSSLSPMDSVQVRERSAEGNRERGEHPTGIEACDEEVSVRSPVVALFGLLPPCGAAVGAGCGGLQAGSVMISRNSRVVRAASAPCGPAPRRGRSNHQRRYPSGPRRDRRSGPARGTHPGRRASRAVAAVPAEAGGGGGATLRPPRRCPRRSDSGCFRFPEPGENGATPRPSCNTDQGVCFVRKWDAVLKQ